MLASISHCASQRQPGARAGGGLGREFHPMAVALEEPAPNAAVSRSKPDWERAVSAESAHFRERPERPNPLVLGVGVGLVEQRLG